MKFRIVEYRKYNKVYYYIQQYYSHFFGLWQGWSSITEYEGGDDIYPGSHELIKFNSVEEAEEYLRKTYTEPFEGVVKIVEL